jgi:hypothetical protein
MICNVQSLNVETLKHDLGSVLPVLGRVEGRFRLSISAYAMEN